MTDDCEYCRQWNQAHPEAEPRASCGPCAVCRAPGHLKAHPRQPTSLCLCREHWDELNAPGYHFELYHLIYVVIVGIAAIQIYPLVARFWGG
ncbi:MAG: hypothetical protein IPO57_03455 [Rhodocyclales bacterium]|nr:hypothetical protein [Rhodocyclales bacterium]